MLGLLLAFRTNQAYQRYWSAIQAWVSIHKVSHNLIRLASSIYFDADGRVGGEESAESSGPANGNSRYATFAYASFVRHLVALPISLKQRLYDVPDPTELWRVLLRAEAEACLRSPTPHLVILASLSLLVLPLKNRDDGAGKALALWGRMEEGLSELQAAACQLDLVASLPPPASYSVHTARFLALWTSTLPFVLVGLFPLPLVPLCTLAVAWALYSTEELAKLLDQPFGRPGDRPGLQVCGPPARHASLLSPPQRHPRTCRTTSLCTLFSSPCGAFGASLVCVNVYV